MAAPSAQLAVAPAAAFEGKLVSSILTPARRSAHAQAKSSLRPSAAPRARRLQPGQLLLAAEARWTQVAILALRARRAFSTPLEIQAHRARLSGSASASASSGISADEEQETDYSPIAIGIGSAVGVCMLIGFFFWLHRHKRRLATARLLAQTSPKSSSHSQATKETVSSPPIPSATPSSTYPFPNQFYSPCALAGFFEQLVGILNNAQMPHIRRHMLTRLTHDLCPLSLGLSRLRVYSCVLLQHGHLCRSRYLSDVRKQLQKVVQLADLPLSNSTTSTCHLSSPVASCITALRPLASRTHSRCPRALCQNVRHSPERRSSVKEEIVRCLGQLRVQR